MLRPEPYGLYLLVTMPALVPALAAPGPTTFLCLGLWQAGPMDAQLQLLSKNAGLPLVFQSGTDITNSTCPAQRQSRG